VVNVPVRFGGILCDNYRGAGEKRASAEPDQTGMDMKKQTLMAAVIGALAAGSIVGGATIALAQADIIKQRQDNRKEAGATMRSIKGVIDAKGDVKAVVTSAAKLKQLELAFDKMFPAGSDKGETKALPTVWSDSAGFAAAGKNADAAYDKLAVAAGSGDLAAVTTAFGDIQKACGACHDKYRAKAN
jgi:cytochrome c556